MTEDGYESQFQVNHLSHFLLTLDLLPLMLDSAVSSGDGRIVFVSSRLHASGQFNPDNINAQQSYSRTAFYSNSKLYNVTKEQRQGGLAVYIPFFSQVMTAFALQRRLRDSRITVSCLHPGSVSILCI